MNAQPWKPAEETEPLSPIEELAANILRTAYAKRVNAVVQAQMEGINSPILRMHFHEPEQFGYVVAALESARQMGIRDACRISAKHVDATYSDKKINKALMAVDAEIQAMRTDKWSVAVAK